MSEHALLPGRPYAALIHTKSASVTITDIKYRLDINTGAHLAAKTLGLNEIATVNVSFDRSVPFTPFSRTRDWERLLSLTSSPMRRSEQASSILRYVDQSIFIGKRWRLRKPPAPK